MVIYIDTLNENYTYAYNTRHKYKFRCGYLDTHIGILTYTWYYIPRLVYLDVYQNGEIRNIFVQQSFQNKLLKALNARLFHF